MDDISRELLKQFTTDEILSWHDLCKQYENELRTNNPGMAIFNTKTEDGAKHWKDLKIRVVEHVSA